MDCPPKAGNDSDRADWFRPVSNLYAYATSRECWLNHANVRVQASAAVTLL